MGENLFEKLTSGLSRRVVLRQLVEDQPLSLLDPLDARAYSTIGIFDAMTF
jgi:hypothetical protein